MRVLALPNVGKSPHLAITLITSHPSIAPALVTGLDHPGVRHRHHPHLLLEHIAGRAVNLPGQRGPTGGSAVHVEPLVRAAHPVGLSLLGESLYLVVVGRDVVHPRDPHLLHHPGAPAAVAGDQAQQGGPRLLVGEVDTVQLGGRHLGGLLLLLPLPLHLILRLGLPLLLAEGSGSGELYWGRNGQGLEACRLVSLSE